MRLLAFIVRALGLSINVTLRMSVMLAVSVFLIWMLVYLFRGQPLGLLLVLALTLFPGMVFLYLSCIRAGLVALKATGPPNLKKLADGTVRLFRFSVMINNMIVTVLGIGGAVAFMIFAAPDLWNQLMAGYDLSDLGQLQLLLFLLTQIPIGILIPIAFALSLSCGLVGTSSGAVAANCAEVGPNHDTLWGATRQFWPLFFLCLLVLFLPCIGLVYGLGGPMTPFEIFADTSVLAVFAIPLYLVWAGCAVCGGKALAYVETAKDLEDEWAQERDGIMGTQVPTDNLREIRLRRQKAGQISAPKVAGGAALGAVEADDLDSEPDAPEPAPNIVSAASEASAEPGEMPAPPQERPRISRRVTRTLEEKAEEEAFSQRVRAQVESATRSVQKSAPAKGGRKPRRNRKAKK